VFGVGDSHVDGDRVGLEDFLAGQTVGLKAAELVDGAVEEGVGSGAGAVDGAAPLFDLFAEEIEIVEGGFEEGAAAQTPGGSGDFVGEGGFEEAFGAKLEKHGLAEFEVVAALFGLDACGFGGRRPEARELREEAALPDSVIGPVESLEFSRLASSWDSEMFVIFGNLIW
jgi:hypothetical protein